MKQETSAFEIHSPGLSDMTLDQQIEVGINDWCAIDGQGREFFGRSKSEAELHRSQHNRASVALVRIDR